MEVADDRVYSGKGDQDREDPKPLDELEVQEVPETEPQEKVARKAAKAPVKKRRSKPKPKPEKVYRYPAVKSGRVRWGPSETCEVSIKRGKEPTGITPEIRDQLHKAGFLTKEEVK